MREIFWSAANLGRARIHEAADSHGGRSSSDISPRLCLQRGIQRSLHADRERSPMQFCVCAGPGRRQGTEGRCPSARRDSPAEPKSKAGAGASQQWRVSVQDVDTPRRTKLYGCTIRQVTAISIPRQKKRATIYRPLLRRAMPPCEGPSRKDRNCEDRFL